MVKTFTYLLPSLRNKLTYYKKEIGKGATWCVQSYSEKNPD